MERMLRTRLMTGLVLVVVFGAGVVLGFAADRSVVAAPVPEAASADSAQRSARPRRHALYEQVEPTDEQKVRIDSILREHREAMKALHAEFRASYNPRYHALIEATRTAIKGVLTPAQAQAYDSLLVDYEKKRAARPSREGRE